MIDICTQRESKIFSVKNQWTGYHSYAVVSAKQNLHRSIMNIEDSSDVAKKRPLSSLSLEGVRRWTHLVIAWLYGKSRICLYGPFPRFIIPPRSMAECVWNCRQLICQCNKLNYIALLDVLTLNKPSPAERAIILSNATLACDGGGEEKRQ